MIVGSRCATAFLREEGEAVKIPMGVDKTKQQGWIVAEEITIICFTGRDNDGKSASVTMYVTLHQSLFLKIHKGRKTSREECANPFP